MNAVTKVTPLEEVRSSLTKMGDQFKMALPPQISPERFQRVSITAVQQNPELLEADRHSLFGACMKAAQDGLLPDGREAALVVYNDRKVGKKVVQYMPMVSGIMKKVRNSGEISTWSVHVVKEGDEFEFQLGDDERIHHKPKISGAGQTIGAYSIVTMKSGEKSRDFMSIEQIEAIRTRSKSKDYGPWVTDFDEMCKKTVTRRHSKRLPMSTDLDELIRRDDDMIDISPQREAAPIQPEEKSQPKPSRLQALIAGSAQRIEPAEIDRETGEIIAEPDYEPLPEDQGPI